MLSVLPILAFQAVWLTCALGAASGTNWPGVIAAAVLATWHLSTVPNPKRAVRTLALAGLLGVVAETALALSGLVTFAATVRPLPIPAWIVALWIAFATTLPVLSRWIGPESGPRWPWNAGALGLVGGPLAYIAGERLGALTMAPGAANEAGAWAWWGAVMAVAIVWAVAAPVLLALRARAT